MAMARKLAMEVMSLSNVDVQQFEKILYHIFKLLNLDFFKGSTQNMKSNHIIIGNLI